MARLTIPDEQTFATFTVVTSTTVFPITFSLFAKADLTVLVDDVALDQSAFTFTGTLLEGGGYDGGTVTLNTAVDDVTVRIERNVAPARTSNFAPASSVPVQSVDQALNRLTANAQDLERKKITTPTFDRAGKFLAFDGDGEPVAASGTGADLGLRSDLVSSSGSSLVGFLQAGTGAVTRTGQAKMRDFVSAFDFIPVALHAGIQASTETTLLTTYLQAALDSGASKIVFPAGKYYTGSLVLPNWIELEGIGYTPTIGGDDRPVELRFSLTSGIGLDCNACPTIKGIWLQNAGGSYNEGTATLSGTTAIAIRLSENAVIEDCGWSLWYECIRTGANTFYGSFVRPHFNRCTFGFYSVDNSPFNLNIFDPKSVLTQYFLSGSGTAYARNTKVIGGSIEGYTSVASHFLDISFFGTYFETISARSGALAFDPGVNGCSISLFGVLAYMDYTARFVNMSGLTGVSLVSQGTVFTGIAPSGAYCYLLPTSGDVCLMGDKFEPTFANDVYYVDSLTNANKFQIKLPRLPAGNVFAGYSDTFFVGPRGAYSVALAAEPTLKVGNMLVPADGDSWDPLGRAQGRPYWVTWQGDRWRDPGGIGPRVTGFGAMTGTATKTAIATYDAPDIEATYTEATIQALADAVQANSRRLKAIDDALRNSSLID
jgi:hypothetical protein